MKTKDTFKAIIYVNFEADKTTISTTNFELTKKILIQSLKENPHSSITAAIIRKNNNEIVYEHKFI